VSRYGLVHGDFRSGRCVFVKLGKFCRLMILRFGLNSHVPLGFLFKMWQSESRQCVQHYVGARPLV
jgi:hypothetical protein